MFLCTDRVRQLVGSRSELKLGRTAERQQLSSCFMCVCAFVAEKQEDEDDFLFGSYQPSAAASSAGNSRPGSRRSVRCVWCDVYECIHLPDLALAAQSGVCVCEWVISYPQGVGVCTYSRPGCPCSLSCEWHDVCVYIFQTWLPPLTQVCVVFVCICVVCLFAYVCVHLSVCLSLSLFICLSLREVKLHP